MATGRIVSFIGGHEGFSSSWYLDPTGTPTIGYGFTWASKVFKDWWMARYGRKMQRGDRMTQPEALEVLKAMIDSEYAPPVDQAFKGQQSRIKEPAYSMVYNCGTGALKWNWARTIASGNTASGIALWRTTGTTSKGQRLPGLARRRNEEADIAEFNRWPDWMGATSSDTTKSTNVAPSTHNSREDIQQAQLWLEALGYPIGVVDGLPGPRTEQATRAFQADHGTLLVDGIIGKATLSALQRSIDLKAKAGKVVLAGGAPAAAGAADKAGGGAVTDALPNSGLEVSDWLLYGGVLLAAIGLAYLAYRYRDELATALRKL